MVEPKSIQREKAAGYAEQRTRQLDRRPATLESRDENAEEQVLQEMLQIRQSVPEDDPIPPGVRVVKVVQNAPQEKELATHKAMSEAGGRALLHTHQNALASPSQELKEADPSGELEGVSSGGQDQSSSIVFLDPPPFWKGEEEPVTSPEPLGEGIDRCQQKGGGCGSDIDCCVGLVCNEVGSLDLSYLNFCYTEILPGFSTMED